MNISSLMHTSNDAATNAARDMTSSKLPANKPTTREAFDSFVGQTFYGQMLKAMRSTVDKPAYFDGGRAEEMFQAQFDQVIAERMAKNNANSFTGPMFDSFLASHGQQPRL